MIYMRGIKCIYYILLFTIMNNDPIDIFSCCGSVQVSHQQNEKELTKITDAILQQKGRLFNVFILNLYYIVATRHLKRLTIKTRLK